MNREFIDLEKLNEVIKETRDQREFHKKEQARLRTKQCRLEKLRREVTENG